MKLSQDLFIALYSSMFRQFYRKHGRDFPWRDKGTTPFEILVAEMLLRQTQAIQVAAVWPSLRERYPGPRELAAADQSALVELLTPLGLGNQRAKALREMSTELIRKHRGRVPRKIEALLALPHVGLYAAHATACFAFGQRVPVVDTNVLRVLGRVFGEKYGLDNRRAPKAWQVAQEIMPPKGSAREHNYGLLDFSALVCTPKKPLCRVCPINGKCTWCWEHVWSKVDMAQQPPPIPPWPR